MPAESKKLDTKCLEPFGGKSGGWVLLQLIVKVWPYFADKKMRKKNIADERTSEGIRKNIGFSTKNTIAYRYRFDMGTLYWNVWSM